MWGIHDIGENNMAWAINNSEFPELLQALIDLSRDKFGFFNKTISRSFEYPYLVNKLDVIKGQHILDIGAGVSPLPVYLALNGASVVTVDNSATVRQLGGDTHTWNGWGFLDYGKLHNNISSLKSDICNVQFSDEIFDCVYSISVVEHMHSQSRRDMWRKMGPWVKASGTVILTLDLVPNTELLWNFCEGQLVEPTEDHGDIRAIQTELAKEGFDIDECKVLRMPPESTTDIALLCCKKADRVGAITT